jgi:hypothetical protein
MTDIVERLRGFAPVWETAVTRNLMNEAADEIERMRADAAEQKEISRLFGELMARDNEKKKIDHNLAAAHARIEDLKRHHKSEINDLMTERAELIAHANVRTRATKRATLIKLDGYLMALSEIENDRRA